MPTIYAKRACKFYTQENHKKCEKQDQTLSSNFRFFTRFRGAAFLLFEAVGVAGIVTGTSFDGGPGQIVMPI